MSYRDEVMLLIMHAYTIMSTCLTPVSCYTGSTKKYLSETWTGWKANRLLAEKAQHTPQKHNPSLPQAWVLDQITSKLEYCLPPARFRQSAMMQVLQFHFQCWSDKPLNTDKLWLVLTAHSLRGLLHQPFKVKNVLLTRLAVIKSCKI